MTLRLYMLQRITALLMAPLVIGHLVTMIYAIRGGLSAAEILSRTQGSLAWFLFYGLFVIAVSVHGAIGLRGIAMNGAGCAGGCSTCSCGASGPCCFCWGRGPYGP